MAYNKSIDWTYDQSTKSTKSTGHQKYGTSINSFSWVRLRSSSQLDVDCQCFLPIGDFTFLWVAKRKVSKGKANRAFSDPNGKVRKVRDTKSTGHPYILLVGLVCAYPVSLMLIVSVFALSATLLSFEWPKESKQRKGQPSVF